MPARRKIMVVDDEEDILRSTEMLLNMLGYDAVPVSSASQTLAVAERERPDVILHDIKMEGLDLARLVTELRNNPGTSQIPFVLFSASGDVATTAAEFDAAGFLAKPFDEEQLTQLLNRVLGRPPPETPRNDAAMSENVRVVFHEYENVLTSLRTYAEVALKTPHLNDQREALRNIERLLGRLENRTEELRNQVLTLIAA